MDNLAYVVGLTAKFDCSEDPSLISITVHHPAEITKLRFGSTPVGTDGAWLSVATPLWAETLGGTELQELDVRKAR